MHLCIVIYLWFIYDAYKRETTKKRASMKPTQKAKTIHMSFALPLELKTRFADVCAEHDISSSQKIRQLMVQFVRENGGIKTAH